MPLLRKFRQELTHSLWGEFLEKRCLSDIDMLPCMREVDAPCHLQQPLRRL